MSGSCSVSVDQCSGSCSPEVELTQECIPRRRRGFVLTVPNAIRWDLFPQRTQIQDPSIQPLFYIFKLHFNSTPSDRQPNCCICARGHIIRCSSEYIYVAVARCNRTKHTRQAQVRKDLHQRAVKQTIVALLLGLDAAINFSSAPATEQTSCSTVASQLTVRIKRAYFTQLNITNHQLHATGIRFTIMTGGCPLIYSLCPSVRLSLCFNSIINYMN